MRLKFLHSIGEACRFAVLVAKDKSYVSPLPGLVITNEAFPGLTRLLRNS